jgi:hypothetical protein
VVPLRFDRARIQALLELAGERLSGEWLLIGGAAAAAWFSPVRTTEDIDLIGLGGSLAERLSLMDLAASAAILSAVDLDDCLALLEHCETSGETIDRARIHARLDTLAPTQDASLVDRRARLRDALGA